MSRLAQTSLAALLCSAAAFAQAAPLTLPLTLNEVLASSAQQAPQIVEAMARVRQAEGRALSAQGSFDTVFDVDAQTRVLGYYSGTYLESKATRPLTGNGGSLYGGAGGGAPWPAAASAAAQGGDEVAAQGQAPMVAAERKGQRSAHGRIKWWFR